MTVTKRAANPKTTALTRQGKLPMMRRPSAEVAAQEDPVIREARLQFQRTEWNRKRQGKRRLCIDVTDDMLKQIKSATEHHGMTQQYLLNFILERELPKWVKP